MERNPSRTMVSFGHLLEWPWTSPWTCFIVFCVKCALRGNFQDDNCSNHSYQLPPPNSMAELLVRKEPFAQESCVLRAAAAIGLLWKAGFRGDTWPLFVVFKGMGDGVSVGILVWEKQLLSLTPFSSPYNSRFCSSASTRAPQMFVSFNSIKKKNPPTTTSNCLPFTSGAWNGCNSQSSCGRKGRNNSLVAARVCGCTAWENKLL